MAELIGEVSVKAVISLRHSDRSDKSRSKCRRKSAGSVGRLAKETGSMSLGAKCTVRVGSRLGRGSGEEEISETVGDDTDGFALDSCTDCVSGEICVGH